ncbi:MAG: carboxypeptidase-like regulatory domain-containing protein [Bacteroidales bacterium]|nr:carboxypeptidase-like regulatory domain-containing protein [Bacteroidales bacterium]
MKPSFSIRVLPLLFLAFFIFSAETLFGQSHTLSGKITDERNRQPLAFVNVVINEGLQGVISDIDGKYTITADEPITKVKFSSIGYEPKEITLQADQKRCNVALTPMTFELGEVTVEAGENPAHRIIDSLMTHRKANNPNSLNSYSYNIYDKMVITIDSSSFGQAVANDTAMEKTNLHYFDSIMKKSDLMVMETASEVLFMAPDRKLQHVLGTKISGMKEPTFMYMVNSMQSVSFYDETVSIVGTDYVNPISRGSKTRYFFTLEAVNPIGQGDSLYVISFHPMRGSAFNGLRGTMTVNSDGWALQSVKTAPNAQGGIFTADIQQLYQKVNGQWFPKQLNLNLIFPSMVVSMDDSTFPMAAVGKSYLSDIEINPDISKRAFSDIEIKVDPDAAYRDETFWDAHRIDSLTERVKATYILVDSLTQGTDIFDRVLGLTNILMTESALPIGCINLDIGHIINLSSIRGVYLGLGGSTNDRLSRWFSINGSVGYWTRIKSWDYSGGLKLKLNRQRQMELDFQYSHKSEAMGEFGGMLEKDNGSLLSTDNYKYTFYENIRTRRDRFDLTYSTRFAHHFKAYLNLSTSHKHYNQQFYLSPSDSTAGGRFTVAELKLRFAYNEKFLSTPQGIRSLGTLYPIVWVSYQHAFPNVLGGEYEYDRFKFEASKNFYTPYLGVAKVLLQAGYATETCPVMETFNILGTYERFGLYSPGSFSAMRLDEFFCDRFVAVYLSHNFSGMLWKTNSPVFKPELSIVTNIGWGDMQRAEACPDKNFKTMEKGYFESGIVIDGLLANPVAKLGLGVFYRYGPYSLPNVWDNFAWKYSASIAF